MLGFGALGFAMRRHGVSPAPLVMGLVLGQLVEENLKQSLILFDGSWLGFFGRPLSLFALIAVSFLVPAMMRGRTRYAERN